MLHAARLTWLVLVIALISVGRAGAIDLSADEPDRELAARDSVLYAYNGMIVDSIIIDNRNIFDTGDPEYANFVFRLANRLNIVTREHVIRREVLLEAGEPFQAELARETARNIRSDYSIYDAWWEIEKTGQRHVAATLITIDQWSLTGGVVVQSEGDETDFEIGFEEENFLGLNQYLALEYEIQEKDDNFFEARFRDRRIFGYDYSLGFRYKDDPTDEVREISFGRPFYNLEQNWSFAVSVSRKGARRDVYDDGSRLLARSTSGGDAAGVEAAYRWGSYLHKTGVKLSYEYNYETTSDRQVVEGVDPSDVSFPDDSLNHTLRTGMFLQNLEFITTRRINGIQQIEDVQLGQSLALYLGRAFRSEINSYDYDLVEFEGAITQRFGYNLLSLTYNRQFWFRKRNDLRRVSQISLRYYNNRISFVTLAGRAAFTRDWRSDSSARLELGGATGLRGFPRRFRVGDRLMVMNLETRWYPGIELWSVLVGGVAFMDFGRVWKPGQATSLEDFQTTVGLGLRISLEKASKARILRVDVSQDEDNRWQFSFGTGQYF
ncbi:hypothetical protein GF420_04285 [candidate division GN15 bacterium]|nr:hypothetical protein [candidate division GN15 bacterium]